MNDLAQTGAPGDSLAIWAATDTGAHFSPSGGTSFGQRNTGLTSLDLKTIADTLGVETVLEGSVRRSGGRVRVTAQLIEAEGGFHLWSQDWERELTADNVFEIQDEIAGARS